MGGLIHVAIRLSNGEAYCVERHTNAIPYWFKHPDMYKNDQRALKYLKQPLDWESNSWPSGGPVRLSNGGGYGLIVFDYVTNTILDNNGYSYMNSVPLAGLSLSRMGAINAASHEPCSYEALLDAGLYNHLTCFNFKTREESEVNNPTKKQINDILNQRDKFMGTLIINTNPMTYISLGDTGYYTFKPMRKALMDIGFPMNKKQGLNPRSWADYK